MTEFITNLRIDPEVRQDKAYVIEDYDYMAYVEKEECKATIRFSNGVCTHDFGSASELISKRSYKITYVMENNCHDSSATGVEIDYRRFYQLDEIEEYCK